MKTKCVRARVHVHERVRARARLTKKGVCCCRCLHVGSS
jgi:hypothetical protein